MKTRNSKLLNLLKTAGEDPLSHDEWIAAWQSLNDAFENAEEASHGFSEIEHAALGSLLDVNINGTSDHVRGEVCRTLDRFKFPAFLVNSDGQISAQNAKVNCTYNISVGDNISSLPIALDQSESIRDVIRSVSKSAPENGGAIFRKAINVNSAHELTLAITNSTSESGDSALVFIINSYFSNTAAALVKRHYGLTDAEREVLTSFVEGYSLKDIAKERQRSHATIRTQFSTLMTKMGAHSQASLLRVALSLSDFTDEIGKFSTILEHPHRRQASIMRVGGRIVEIGFCGDPSGTPMLHIPNIAENRFNAEVERALFKTGLYLITVMPPAQGKTDPPLKGDCIKQLRIDDINTVLDTLNIESCPVVVSRSGTHEGFNLAASLPTRISQIILLSACPLGDYWTKHGTGSSYFDAALRIGEKYPTMKKIIISAGVKAWVTLGAKQFYRMQLIGSDADKEIQMRPENVLEIEHALASTTAFGISAAIEELSGLLVNYKDTVLRSNCGISIIHGNNDMMLPIEAMRDFKADFPDRVQIFEFEDAGFTVLLSHTEEVVKLLSQIAQDSEKLHSRSLSMVNQKQTS